MAGTFTLTGRFKRNDGVTPYVNSTIRYQSSPYPDLADNTVYSSDDTIVTDENGEFSVVLVTEPGLYYRLASKDDLFDPNPFTFAAPSAGTTIDVTDLTVFDPSTITSSVATAAAASAAAAAASAASVVREGNSGVAGLDANGLPIRSVPLWRASTTFATGQVVQAPNSGALLRRTTGATSRASFDATEQALWTPVTGVWDIRTFDAVANGTSDNATAINNAITACNAAGGGTVLVPAAASPFATGSTITLKANVTLCVMGTIKALASHTGVGITASDVSNVEVCGNGTLDMNKAATTNGGNVNTQQGILIGTGSATAVTNVRVRDLTVTNCWHYGVMTSAQIASSSISDVLIDNVTVTNAGQDAIINVGLGNTSTPTSPPPATSSGYVITRCVVTNPSVNGIHCVGVSDVHVGANLLTATASTGHGICMGSGGASTVDHTTDFTVTENKVRGFTGSSCFGILASARSTRFDISGNKIRGCWGAISTDVVDPNNTSATILVDGTVANNSCIGSTGFHGIYSQGLTGLTITGNVCRGNAQSGILLALAVSVSVTGNDSINNTGTGIALTGTTGGIGGHTVTGNTTTGNGGGAYYNECPVVSTLDAAAVPPSTLTTQQSLANSTAETTQFTYAIPPNLVQAGTTYRITLGYVIDNVATSGILTLRLYGWSGGTLLSTLVLPSQAGAATNQPLYLDYLLTVRNISASTGRVMVMGNVRSEFSALSKAFGGIVSTTINTSAVASLLMTAQWGTASASNVCRLELASVDVLKS